MKRTMKSGFGAKQNFLPHSVSDQSNGEEERWYRQAFATSPVKHNISPTVFSFEIRGVFYVWFSGDYAVTFETKKAKDFLLISYR